MECCRMGPESSINDLTKPADLANQGKDYAASVQEQDFTVREAIKTSAFWLILIASMGQSMAQNAIVIHTIPFLTDMRDQCHYSRIHDELTGIFHRSRQIHLRNSGRPGWKTRIVPIYWQVSIFCNAWESPFSFSVPVQSRFICSWYFLALVAEPREPWNI